MAARTANLGRSGRGAGARDGRSPAPSRLRRLRALWITLAVLVAAGLAIHAPGAGSALHDFRLRRMSVPQLEAAVRQRPDDLAARYRLGLAYSRTNRQVEAMRELLAVLQKDPTRAEVLNDLGALYLLQQRYYESLVALRAALEARPGFATAYANLGRLHMATKMPFTAVRELEQAARREPRNVETLCDLGEAYERTLKFESAKTAYLRAMRLRPRSVQAHLGLGKTCYSLTEYDQAEAALARTLALEPDNPQALSVLGRMRFERAVSDAEVQAARDLMKRAARGDPQDPETWFDLGRVALRQGKAGQAVELLRRALQLSPDHPGATVQLGKALRASGQTHEAEQLTASFQARALLFREQSRLEEQVYQHPDDWDSLAHLAGIDIRLGDTAMAALRVRNLGEGSPDHPALPRLREDLARRSAGAPPGTATPPAGNPGSGGGHGR